MRHYKRPDTPNPDPELLGVDPKTGQKPGHPMYEREKFPGEFNIERPKGKVYDKKPFRLELIAGKRYMWCTCGHAKMSQVCSVFSIPWQTLSGGKTGEEAA